MITPLRRNQEQTHRPFDPKRFRARRGDQPCLRKVDGRYDVDGDLVGVKASPLVVPLSGLPGRADNFSKRTTVHLEHRDKERPAPILRLELSAGYRRSPSPLSRSFSRTVRS